MLMGREGRCLRMWAELFQSWGRLEAHWTLGTKLTNYRFGLHVNVHTGCLNKVTWPEGVLWQQTLHGAVVWMETLS